MPTASARRSRRYHGCPAMPSATVPASLEPPVVRAGASDGVLGTRALHGRADVGLELRLWRALCQGSPEPAVGAPPTRAAGAAQEDPQHKADECGEQQSPRPQRAAREGPGPEQRREEGEGHEALGDRYDEAGSGAAPGTGASPSRADPPRPGPRRAHGEGRSTARRGGRPGPPGHFAHCDKIPRSGQQDGPRAGGVSKGRAQGRR